MDLTWKQSVGEQIRRWRIAAGITQDELAKHAGITRGHLYKYEYGKVPSPSAYVLAKITEHFGKKLNFNGIVLGPEQISPRIRDEKKPEPVQLELDYKTAREAVKVWSAISKGAELKMKKRGKRAFLLIASFPSKRRRRE